MRRRMIVAALLAILACVLNAATWARHADAARAWRSTTIALSSPARVEAVEPALHAIADVGYAAYGQAPNVKLESAAYPDRGVQVTVLRFTGDADCIAFFSLTGAMPRFDQLDACALDRGTAHRLWGSEDVIGQRLRAQEGEYAVSGVLNTDRPTMVVYARAGENVERIAIQTQDRRSGYSRAEEIAAMLAINGSISDDQERVALWAFFVLAPFFVAAIFAPYVLRLRKSLCAVYFCVLGGIFLYILLTTLPARFFPNHWSDFGFYALLPQIMQAFVGSDDMTRDAMMAHDRNLLAAMSIANCALIIPLLVSVKSCWSGFRSRMKRC